MSDLVGIPEDRFSRDEAHSSKIKLLLTDRSLFILLFRFLFHRLTDKRPKGERIKYKDEGWHFNIDYCQTHEPNAMARIGIEHRTDAKSDEILACCKCKIVQQVRQHSKSVICLFEGKRPR